MKAPIARNPLRNDMITPEWRAYFDYLDNVTGNSGDISKRQTVLSGSVDADGFADFISAGTGLACNLAATDDPIYFTIADGYSEYGTVDYRGKIFSDATGYWSGLTANATNFLYIERDNVKGTYSGGNTVNLPPIYGTTYNNAGGIGQSLNLFEGTDGATTCTDENADVTWAFSGNAQIDTAVQFTSDNANSILFDGVNSYITSSGLTVHAGENEGGFSIDFWFYATGGAGTNRCILTGLQANKIALFLNTSNQLALYLGNGSTWSIANGTAGTTATSLSTKYHVKLQWDGSTYKVYMGTSGTETEEISVSSSTAFASATGFLVGVYVGAANDYTGNIGLLRYNIGPQTNTSPSVPTTAYKGLAMDGEHWFDLNTFKMKSWNDTTGVWDEKQRIFVGEAVTDGSSVTSVITYALRGEYDSGWFASSATTNYSKSHNIGCQPQSYDALGRDPNGVNGYYQYYNVSNAYGGNVSRVLRNTLRFSTHTFNQTITGSGAAVTCTQSRITASRGW